MAFVIVIIVIVWLSRAEHHRKSRNERLRFITLLFVSTEYFKYLFYTYLQTDAPDSSKTVQQGGKHGFSATCFSVPDYPLMVFHYTVFLFQVFPVA